MNLTTEARTALLYLLAYRKNVTVVRELEVREELRQTGIVINIPGLKEVMCLKPGYGTDIDQPEYYVPFRDEEIEQALHETEIYRAEVHPNGEDGFYVHWN